ncbi:MAG: hypothetical protein U9Q81_01070 [Pseudomonadota bacterium]|nr:hypothetical protein [Pseudomonadota bacterium]
MDRALIDTATKALDVEAVFLRASEIRCKEGFMPQFIEDDLSLVPQYRVGPKSEFHVVTATNKETHDSTKTAMYYFAAGVRLIDGTMLDAAENQEDLPDEAVYVEIKTEFCAHYGLDGAADEKELRPALEEFGRFNIGYHVWPYWREYVQSVCARMGIPPIPVPMYRIPQPEPDSAPEPE